MFDGIKRTCVITGATSGIGKSTACALADEGFRLVLVGRNEQAGRRLERRLRRRSPRSNVDFVRTDLSRREDVRALAAVITSRYDHIDVLINNAGARNYEYRENDDGIEVTFAANHLGHFLLTCLLIDALKKAPSARVITVSSGLHASVNAEGDWCLDRDHFDGAHAYAKSKLANLMFAYELARRLRHTCVTSNAVNPGIVATNFERNNGLRRWLGFLVGHGLKRRLASAQTGARTVVFLAVSDVVAGVTGQYFVDDRRAESSAASHDVEAARRLWDLSVQLLRVADREISIERRVDEPV